MKPLTPAENARRRTAWRLALAEAPDTPALYASKVLGNVRPNPVAEWARNDPECQAMKAAQIEPEPQPLLPVAAQEVRDAAFWRRRFQESEKQREEAEHLAAKLAGIRDIPIDPVPWASTPARDGSR